jgi:hypothetical protein
VRRRRNVGSETAEGNVAKGAGEVRGAEEVVDTEEESAGGDTDASRLDGGRGEEGDSYAGPMYSFGRVWERRAKSLASGTVEMSAATSAGRSRKGR